MEIMTSQQMQDIDRKAIEEYGIPSIVLMENAGRGAAEELLKNLTRYEQARVLVVCGTGNNGGDGLVAARHLLIAGVKVKVFITGQEEQLKQDVLINYRILKAVGGEVSFGYPPMEEIQQADMVVDAIFGIGLNREIMEPFRSLIEQINQHAKRIIALDVPSGLDATSGGIFGVCIKADKTITFHRPKYGLVMGVGRSYAGIVITKHIGF